jgi:hypothetical protein
MQRPRRESKRQSREKEVAWRGGLGRDEVVRPVAQEASAEVMMVRVVCGRKKKKVAQERERLEGEEREKVTVVALPLVRSWVDGNDSGKAGCGGGGRWQRKQKKTGGAAERREKSTVALGGCVGFLWWSWYLWWCVGRVCWYYRWRRQLWKRWREKERKTERKLQKQGKS